MGEGRDYTGGYYAAAPGEPIAMALLHTGWYPGGRTIIEAWKLEDIPHDADYLGEQVWEKDNYGDGKVYPAYKIDTRKIPYEIFRKYIGGGDGYMGLWVTCPHCCYRNYIFGMMMREHFTNCKEAK